MINYLSLADVCLDIIDCPHESPEWKTEGVPVIRNFNLINGQLDMQEIYYVDEETYIKRTKRATPEEGDIIFSREAPIGNCAIVPSNFKCCLGQRLVLLRVNHSICSSEYLLVALQSPYVKRQIEQVSKRGSIVSNFAIGDLQNLMIPILDNQYDIAYFDNMIANKININNSICSDLEAMAKQIYDYWFVQFDFPDENGKPYKSSGGKMVWNEELNREIPEGWNVDNLYGIADFINGLACQKYRPVDDNHRLPVIKITEMHDGITGNTEWARDDVDSKYIIEDGTLLFSWSASLEIQLWNSGKGVLNQHIFNVVPKVNSKSYVYFELLECVKNFKRMAEARKTTMGHITTDHLNQSRIVIPSDNILVLFEQQVSNIFNQITNVNKENRQLTELRDFLLPMMMNEQVKVGKDGE